MNGRSTNIKSLVADLALLNEDERDELMKALLKLKDGRIEKNAKITELKGLGKEMWEEVDVDKYVRELRDEWDDRRH